MDKKQIAFILACALSASVARAQTDNPYNGTWTLAFDGKRTAGLEGSVTIQDGGGRWKVVAHARRDPCLGREYPITVQKATAEELVFEVHRSKTLAGCLDSTYTFKRMDDKTLKGELDNGRPASLTRE